MAIPSVIAHVENASLVIRHFGAWPSLHDAEILVLVAIPCPPDATPV